LSSGEVWLLNMLKQRCLSLASLERTVARLRSRIHYLKEGDANTKFFHLQACYRKKKNFISKHEEDGRMATNHDDMQQILEGYFCNLLGADLQRHFTIDLSNCHRAAMDLRAMDLSNSQKKSASIPYLNDTPSAQTRISKESNVGRPFNPDEIVVDPALRRQIGEYNINVQDEVRRAYILKGPCQPRGLDFPRRQYGQRSRHFQEQWYENYDWLEYNESKDASYCFYCFLFKQLGKGEKYEAFTKVGYNNWKDAVDKFRSHVGGVNSIHNMLDCILMILIIKDKAYIMSCLVLLVSLKSSIKSD
jgi:hypothetical protein